MKKVLFAAAAIAAMASCTKTTEVVYEPTGELTLSPLAYVAVKANGPITGTAYPADEEFNVFAGHTAMDPGTAFANAGEIKPYLTDVTFAKASNNAAWAGKTPYYWPKAGSLFFTGYSPARAKGTATVDYTQENAGITITDFTQGAYAAEKNAEMVDLMWFDMTANSANSGAPAAAFKHALSYITFNFKATTEQLFNLKKVTVKGVGTKGTFTSKDRVWTEPTVDTEITIFDGTQELTNNAFTRDNLLVIPQTIDAKAITIVYEQHSSAGSAETITVTESFELPGGDGAAPDTAKWLLGKHYTYNFTFTPGTGGGEDPLDGQILLTPEVEDWVKVADKETEIK